MSWLNLWFKKQLWLQCCKYHNIFKFHKISENFRRKRYVLSKSLEFPFITTILQNNIQYKSPEENYKWNVALTQRYIDS